MTISFNEPLKDGGSVTIHDLQGRSLFSKKVLHGDGEAILATNSLPNGFYTVKLTVDGRVLSALKLAIAH